MTKRCNLCAGRGNVSPAKEVANSSKVVAPATTSLSLLSDERGRLSGYCTLSLRRLVPGWPRKKGEGETMGKAIVRVDHHGKDSKETEREDATFGSWWRKEWPTLK
ncbi:MAG: hypothetical protein ACE5LG_01015 [Anaerolineae bacterium]